MTEVAFFPDEGKMAFTRFSGRLSFCEAVCCSLIPRVLQGFIYAIQDISPTSTTIFCLPVSLIKQPAPNDNKWVGSVTTEECTDPATFEVRVQCDDDPPVPDKNDCNQVLSVFVNDVLMGNVEVCCCEGSTSSEKACVVSDGFADALGLDPKVGNTCGYTSAQDTNITVWVYNPVSSGNPCCRPNVCPPDDCPGTPCNEIEAQPVQLSVRIPQPTIIIDSTVTPDPLNLTVSVPAYMATDSRIVDIERTSAISLGDSYNIDVEQSIGSTHDLPLGDSYSLEVIKAATECACQYCVDPFPNITAAKINNMSGTVSCCANLGNSINLNCSGSGDLCQWDSGWIECDMQHNKRIIVRVTATKIQGVLQIQKSGFGIHQVNYEKTITPDIDCDAEHILEFFSESTSADSNPCTTAWNTTNMTWNPGGSGP